MNQLPLYVNGRFAAQKLSGVQRFAIEMTTALQARYGDRLKVLVPPDATLDIPGATRVGRFTGQLWEQFELPRLAANGVLLNLGNTAPVFARRQLVVIHDAGVFSVPEAYSAKFRMWYKFLHHGLAWRGARLVTVSKFSRSELAKNLRLQAARITVISEGADHMERVGVEPEILSAHGLRPGSYVFAVGTLAPHKNLVALGALAEALASRNMALVISGGFGAAAFQGTGTAQLPAAAQYLGRVSDAALKTLFTNAACYIFPSRYEGFGLPAVEAMACGCAVLAADIPALRETCGDGAFYFDPLLPDDIVAKTLGLLDAPGALAALRARAAVHVKHISWARAAQALSCVVDEVAA